MAGAAAMTAVAGTARLTDVPLRWVLVAPGEHGLRHRLARVVRGTPGGVLVDLHALPPAAAGAQLGISPRARPGGNPHEVLWFAGLTATDVALAQTWIASGDPEPPEALAARLVAHTRAG